MVLVFDPTKDLSDHDLTVLQGRRQCFLDALRSGYWVQGKGCLNDGKFCCQGIGCDLRVRISDDARWIPGISPFTFHLGSQTLQRYWRDLIWKDFFCLQKEDNLQNEQASRLDIEGSPACMNDAGHNFCAIANHFQHLFENVTHIKTKHGTEPMQDFSIEKFEQILRTFKE